MPSRQLIFAKLSFLGRVLPSLAPLLSVEARGFCKRAEAMIKVGGRRLASKKDIDAMTMLPPFLESLFR